MADPRPVFLRTLSAVALGAAAVILAPAFGAGDRQTLEDVQIGERGELLRVALICSSRCAVAPDGKGGFELSRVDTSLDIDLSARSALVSRLTIVPDARGGSLLSIDAIAQLNGARIVECKSDSGLAPCIEFRFAREGVASNAAAPKPQPLRERVGAAPSAAPVKEKAKDLPFLGTITLAPSPALRDGPTSAPFNLPDFAPPERMAPKASAPDGGPDASLQSDIPAAAVARPTLVTRSRPGARSGGAFDIAAETKTLLGKSLDIGACEGAKARLAADAWALDSMIDVAFCKASRGDLDEADADFERLLAYTPDNYEALVGRGLIASAKGERARSMTMMQEALNALPPIAESDRIVAWMDRN